MEAYAKAAELDPSFKEPLNSISKLTEEQQALKASSAAVREVVDLLTT